MSEPAPHAESRPTGRHDPLEIHPGRASLDVPFRRVVDDGLLVIVRNGLQLLDALEPLRRATRLAAAETLPPTAARALERTGIEGLHTVVGIEEAMALRTRMETALRPSAAQACLAFAATAGTGEPRVHVSRHFGVRTMLPHRVVAERDDLGPLAGFVVPTAPHVDSWFNTTLNSVNLWMALGRVRPGNGLLVYPDLYRAPIRRAGYDVAPGQQLGTPVSFALDPGDILLFSGDHVHASEANTTDETRVVLTKRISVGAPRYNPEGSGWVPYDDARLLRGPLAPLASLRSRATAAYGRHLLRAALRRRPGYERARAHHPTSGPNGPTT
ncbi:phytanoyl-CoA dioxygenase family protein [Streptomyces spiramenti]|uniref:Phytanoyl-CoA dioxygenase family protein n=1 Tax=Streptomyces spiramenti TaxID=2720606 RepID=A0ABX1AMT1_9ACTN|nr:phytanoyl-CoA dioxygenase family protein [Streptomyces spiramenti]NJP65762.1 phytanoyl-CoA dioxygenase family protein [Streptomyces spiramenti]